jgi:hypothetical protein
MTSWRRRKDSRQDAPRLTPDCGVTAAPGQCDAAFTSLRGYHEAHDAHEETLLRVLRVYRFDFGCCFSAFPATRERRFSSIRAR